jgi:nucleoside-diphosphate-sugar epimerase
MCTTIISSSYVIKYFLVHFIWFTDKNCSCVSPVALKRGLFVKKIVVTGGSGTAGQATIRELLAHSYQVLNIDVVRPAEYLSPFLQVDLTEFGEVVEALHGADAVIHLGAIPSSGLRSEEVTFRTNISATYNVFQAAKLLGLQRVVWASSVQAIGIPYRHPSAPAYFPVDEEYPMLAGSSYSLSKILGEEMAKQFQRWCSIPFIGLRFAFVVRPELYARFFKSSDIHGLKSDFWAYVDLRDAARSCRLALEADIEGAENFLITAADVSINIPSRTLIETIYPEVPLRKEIGEFESLISIAKARRMLGYEPQHSWRDEV